MTPASPARSAWLFYCLLAIVLWGVWGIVSKAAEQRLSPAAIQVVSVIGVVPAALVLLASPRLRKGDNFLLGGAAAFGTGLCGSVGNLLMLLSFTHGGEASAVMPLTGMFPLVTIVLAVLLLGERMNRIQIGGIVLALAAIYLFSLPPEAAASPAPAAGTTQPSPGSQGSWHSMIPPWMAYALGALVLWGVAGVLQKIATNHISTELSTILFALAFIPVALVVARIQPFSWRISAAGWLLAISFGALIGVGTLLLFAAYRGGKASIVTALYALYPALTVVLAVPIFGERIDLRKGAAIVLAILAGVALSLESEAPPTRGFDVVTPAGADGGAA
jgi:drug/metabolite transporter (DMT)-like permease